MSDIDSKGWIFCIPSFSVIRHKFCHFCLYILPSLADFEFLDITVKFFDKHKDAGYLNRQFAIRINPSLKSNLLNPVELGRIERTLFILDWLQSVKCAAESTPG